MVQASVAGAINFEQWHPNKVGWRRLFLVLKTLDTNIHAKLLELDANKAAAFQGIEGVKMSPSEKENYAKEAIDRYQAVVLPWFGRPGSQNTNTSYQEDRMAEWVSVFGRDPELLKQIEELAHRG